MKRPAALWLLACLLAGAFFSARSGVARAGRLPAWRAVGFRAPGFTLPQARGGLRLAALRGRPVLLNFWASWCIECRREMPVLERFHRAEGARLTIVGIDVRESPAVALAYTRPRGFGWTFAFDRSGAVADAYGVHFYPTSFFLDRTGVIRATYTGAMSLRQMRVFLRLARAPGR